MKYPRTYHLPWSPGRNDDKEDKILHDVSCFAGKDVIYLEKMDGENTVCSCDSVHARSEDSGTAPWQTYMARMHACFRHNIPKGMFVCGECMYAIHSIKYTKLPTCFFVFGIMMNSEWMSWQDVCEWAEILCLDTVPVITTGKEVADIGIPRQSAFGPECEGYVVRATTCFDVDTFKDNVAKCVRHKHVKTDKHWRDNWKPASFLSDPIGRMYNGSSCQNHTTNCLSSSGHSNGADLTAS